MINANNDSYKYELLLVFYCTDVIYCVLIYYFLIHASLPSDDFFHPLGMRYTPIRQVTITGE